MIRVLLVRTIMIRDTTRYFLNSQQNYKVVCAETGSESAEPCPRELRCHPDGHPSARTPTWHGPVPASTRAGMLPIIFVLSQTDTDTMVPGALELGGDDFLAKPYSLSLCWPASWRTSAGCRWTRRAQRQRQPPHRRLYAGLLTPLRREGRPEHPSGRHGVPHPLSFRRYPNTFLHSQRAVPEDLGQSLGDVRTGAGAHPQSAATDSSRIQQAHLPEKCLGKGVCVPAGWLFQASTRAKT